MKKLFKYMGIISLILISFIITEKTSTVMKETDEIMIKIKEEKNKYGQEPINAKIEENKITPGIYGKEINQQKTYEKMKKIGKYNPEDNIYNQIKPQISIEDIYDKYIESGNKIKKEVSIILIVNDDMKEIEDFKDEKVTLLKINQLLSGNKDFTQNQYCYLEKYDKSKISKCKKEKKHTIKITPINKNLLKYIKKNLSNGKIITIELNEQNKKELKLTINYIKNKGYKIVKIEDLLSEKNTN